MGYRSGWHSTKLHLALITMALLTVVYMHAGSPESAFDGYSISIIAAAGIYSGSRVAESFAQRSPRARPAAGAPPSPPSDDDYAA